LPLTARAVTNGLAQAGVIVNFLFDQGTGSLSAGSAVTNSTGYASVTLTLTNFIANVQLSVCVAPANNPCQTIYGNAVAPAMMNLEPVSGAAQMVSGTTFQPLVVRVTDSSMPPNPVQAASVLFQSTLLRPPGDNLIPGSANLPQTGTPVILSVNQSTVQSDANGLASLLPSVGSFSGNLEIEIQISAGSAATLLDELELFPASE
jgi:hypothetical protein